MRKFVTALILSCVFVSCAVNKEAVRYISGFPKESSAKFQLLESEDSIRYSMPQLFTGYKSYLVLANHAGRDNSALCIYDKNTGELVLEAIPWGKDKGQVESNWIQHFDKETGIMYFWDFRTNKSLSFQLDSLILHGDDAIQENSECTECRVALGGTYFTRFGRIDLRSHSSFEDPINREPIITLSDDSGNILAKLDSLNFLPGDIKWRPQIRKSFSTLSPNERKLATILKGGTIILCSVGKKKLKHYRTISQVENVEILYSKDRYEFIEDDKFFHRRITATNKYIYGIYDGLTHRSAYRQFLYSEDYSRADFTKIAIYDWKGRPVELIHTDHKIVRTYTDEDDSILYAVIVKDGKLRFGVLELK